MNASASQTIERAARIHVPAAAVSPWPLGELVVGGTPCASGAVLSKSGDERQVRGIWDCTPGSFRWDWTCDETVVVVSGRATVDLDDGRKIDLQPGDMAFFGKGTRSVWTIHEHFRKGFHLHSEEPMAM